MGWARPTSGLGSAMKVSSNGSEGTDLDCRLCRAPGTARRGGAESRMQDVTAGGYPRSSGALGCVSPT